MRNLILSGVAVYVFSLHSLEGRTSFSPGLIFAFQPNAVICSPSVLLPPSSPPPEVFLIMFMI